jgi:hypothetical protein
VYVLAKLTNTYDQNLKHRPIKYFKLGSPADIVLDPPLDCHTHRAVWLEFKLETSFWKTNFCSVHRLKVCISIDHSPDLSVSLRHPFSFLILAIRFLGGVLVQLLAFVRLLPRQLTSVPGVGP